MSAPAGKLTALVLAFQRHGITRREDRIRLCIDHAGRHLTSSADLTGHEVDVLLERLAALPVGNLPAVVARLHRAEEQRAAAAAARTAPDPNRVLTPGEVAARLGATIVCTNGRGPTEHDVALLEEFGQQLELRASGH